MPRGIATQSSFAPVKVEVDSDIEIVENVPPSIRRGVRRQPPAAKSKCKVQLKQGGKSIKAEQDVEDIASILGGISLNTSSTTRAEVDPKAKQTPSKRAPVAPGVKAEPIDLTYDYVSPFPTPARPSSTARPAVAPRTPLFLPHDSDSDVPPPTTRRSKPSRRIRDPDSDSEVELTKSRPSSPIPPQDSAGPSSSRPSRPLRSARKPVVSRFLDIEAKSYRDKEDIDSEDDYDREEHERKWRTKYYDDSLGSLRDFIVDDDYVWEKWSSEESADEVSEEEVPSRRRSRADKKDGSRTQVTDPRSTKTKPTSAGTTRVAKELATGSSVPPNTHKPITPAKSRIIELLDSDDSDNPANSPEKEDEPPAAILHFSPPPSRLLTLPDLSSLNIISESDSDRSPPPTPARGSTSRRVVPPTPKTPASKKKWVLDRAQIAQAIFDELDRKVFEHKLGPKGAGTRLEWNNRLLTTAGQAHSKRATRPDGTKVEDVKIILSEKVLTGEEQILSTVAHEMCHVASWVISNERKNPHGRIFKSWGNKVMRARPDIEVTTKHGYEIEYKFQWRCTRPNCDKIYKRHSKSIDIDKQACGRCRGRLRPMFESKKETAFQIYLRENMATAKSAMPGSSHGDVMRALSAQWTAGGPEADHQGHWNALALAVRA